MKTNRLIHETSPYLRQHAHNPVDWFPWGEEALEKARKENKPIFLSVGYSACHWCHVMERESFENPEIAQLLNERFISIKVDREERPDLDHIYMNVVQLMTGHGGWPMSVFLAPDQTPIFGGTYFPPGDRHGMPGFPRVVTEVARIYREQPPELATQTEHLLKALKTLSSIEADPAPFAESVLEKSADDMVKHHDETYGGFGGAPKFPQTMAMNFLMRAYKRFGKKEYLEVVRNTLTKMARGGIYDHLAGGFARYSVDEQWAVPHFEKMLYDNALLAVNYFEGFQLTAEPFFKSVGRGILDYVLNEMTSSEGSFYSSQDADSEGEEGKFYVWDPQEIKAVLGETEGAEVARYFGVDAAGNFEHGKTVLYLKGEWSGAPEKLEAARAKLLAARKKRVAPGRDEKILTSWNALMIRGFVRGYQVTLEAKYLQAAERAAAFLLKHVVDDKGKDRLRATYKDGKAKHAAYLDDYAYMIAALLDLFEATGKLPYLEKAEDFKSTVLKHFIDTNGGGFFFTADDHERLIDRPRSLYDASIPSGNSVMLDNMLRLGTFTDPDAAANFVEKQLSRMAAHAGQRPIGFASLLNAADRLLGPGQELVLTGDAQAPAYAALQRAIGETYLPHTCVILQTPSAGAPFVGLKDIVAGKPAAGAPQAFVCSGRVCSEPLSAPEALRDALKKSL